MSPNLAAIMTTLALYAAVVISPGPNFALVTRLAVSGARSTALKATFGFAVAATFYAVLSMAGLAVLLEQVGWLARAVQIAGGCYLIYLGIGAWVAAKKPAAETCSDVPHGWSGFRTGFLVTLANPKGIAFFVSLYGVAIPHDAPLWVKVVIIAGGFAIEIVWYSLVTFLLSTKPVRAAYDRSRAWIERSIGAVLAAFGTRLILEKA